MQTHPHLATYDNITVALYPFIGIPAAKSTRRDFAASQFLSLQPASISTIDSSPTRKSYSQYVDSSSSLRSADFNLLELFPISTGGNTFIAESMLSVTCYTRSRTRAPRNDTTKIETRPTSFDSHILIRSCDSRRHTPRPPRSLAAVQPNALTLMLLSASRIMDGVCKSQL